MKNKKVLAIIISFIAFAAYCFGGIVLNRRFNFSDGDVMIISMVGIYLFGVILFGMIFQSENERA